jgi:hypothetical protein
MVEAAPIGVLNDATTHHGRGHLRRTQDNPLSFKHLLNRAVASQPAQGSRTGGQPVAARAPASVPASSDAALSQAMTIENVPASWKSSLSAIMAQESGGQVNVQAPHHSARGLFQLTAANYHYNPNGAASFGNAVQEAQGGIRYVRQRYGSADNAAAFWQAHHWY